MVAVELTMVGGRQTVACLFIGKNFKSISTVRLDYIGLRHAVHRLHHLRVTADRHSRRVCETL